MSENHQFIISFEDSENIRYQEGGKHMFFGFERGAVYVPSNFVWRDNADAPIETPSGEKYKEILKNLEEWLTKTMSMQIRFRAQP